MPDTVVTVKYTGPEYRAVRAELELWLNKMETHAKTLPAGREKAQLTKRGMELKRILGGM